MTTSLSEIEDLVPLGGGWALRSLHDYLVQSHVNCVFEPSAQLYELANRAKNTASGLSAVKHSKLIQYYLPGYEHTPINKEFSGKVDTLLSRDVIDRSTYFGIASDNYWSEELKRQINSTELSSDLFQKYVSSDVRTKLNTIELVNSFTLQVVRSIGLPWIETDAIVLDEVEHEITGTCWRRWYTNNARAIIVIDPARPYFHDHRWFTCCVIHDGAHLLHIMNEPDNCSSSVPNKLAMMEIFAMYIELKALHFLQAGFDLEDFTDGKLNNGIVKAYLMQGLLDRSLRMQFDKAIHFEAQAPEVWKKECIAKYKGLVDGSFCDEFHGLPGLPTAYMRGPELLHILNDSGFLLESLNNPSSMFSLLSKNIS